MAHNVRQVAAQLPPGFVDESRAPQVVAGNAVLQALGTLVFFSRAYSRLFLNRSWKAEDYVLTSAWVFATAYSTCQYAQVAHGSGHHLAVVVMNNPSDTVEAQKWAYAAQMCVLFALALPKISIGLSYLRIFYSDRSGRRMIQALMALIIIQIFPFSIEFIFQCKPIHVYWTEGRPQDKCLQDTAGLYVNGSINVLTDLALMGIVMPRILDLHLNRRQKRALVGILSLGIFAVIAGIVRMVRVGTTITRPDFDPTWDMYDVSIWSSTEIYVSLICASAPGVKPLASKILPKLLGTSLASRTRTTGPQFGSIELSSKLKRSTISSMHVRKGSDEFGLATMGAGPYTEVGRGIDKEVSIGEKRDESPDSGIYKTQEVTVHSTTVR